ncbi:hypothetical protein BDV19DRAFT_385348 [Aspergillus venezuelensis]
MNEKTRTDIQRAVLSHTSHGASLSSSIEEPRISKVSEIPTYLRNTWAQSYDLDYKTKFIVWGGKTYRPQTDGEPKLKVQDAYIAALERDGTMEFGKKLLSRLKSHSQSPSTSPDYAVDEARVLIEGPTMAEARDGRIEAGVLRAIGKKDLEALGGFEKQARTAAIWREQHEEAYRLELSTRRPKGRSATT